MALGKQKLCISKKYTYIGLFIIAGFLLIFLNYQFLKTKPSTNTRAQIFSNKKKLPKPGPLTSDPKKILPYWMAVELALAEQTIKSSITYTGNVDLYSSINRLDPTEYEFLGEIKVNDLNQFKCLGTAVYYTPLSMIFRQFATGGVATPQMTGFWGNPMRLSLFKNMANSEIDGYISYLTTPEGAGKIVPIIRYIPYKAFVEAFSDVMRLPDKRFPLTNTAIIPSEVDKLCDIFQILQTDRTLDYWNIWTEKVVKSDLIEPYPNRVPSTPFPPRAQTPTPNIFQAKIDKFTNGFEQYVGNYQTGYGSFLPEVVIGALREQDVWGRWHVTYFVEGGRLGSKKRPNSARITDSLETYGNYSKLLLLLSYFKTDNEGDPNHLYSFGINNAFSTMLTPVPTAAPDNVNVYDDNTFINYIRTHCESGVYDAYNDTSPLLWCPKIPKADEKLIRDGLYLPEFQKGAFILHFKALESPCIGTNILRKWWQKITTDKCKYEGLFDYTVEEEIANIVINVGMGSN